jgi:hypothetical protein
MDLESETIWVTPAEFLLQILYIEVRKIPELRPPFFMELLKNSSILHLSCINRGEPAMGAHTITLTDEQELAYAARVAFLQAASTHDPPAFPPVVPVANVDELIASVMEAPNRSMVQWYFTQS